MGCAHGSRAGRHGAAQRLRALAPLEPARFGYLRPLLLQRREGFKVNYKQLFRIYRAAPALC